MKIDAYKCDACGKIFDEPEKSRIYGISIRLNFNKRYESISDPPNWNYEHVCESCRVLLHDFMRRQNWVPTEGAEVPLPDVPTPPTADAKTEEPF